MPAWVRFSSFLPLFVPAFPKNDLHNSEISKGKIYQHKFAAGRECVSFCSFKEIMGR